MTLILVTRPFFSRERVTDLILYERKAAIAIQKMQERFDAGLAVDFQVILLPNWSCSTKTHVIF